ncbi:hypothetical protein GCM10011610_69630 [Nocardia rhizosphaerihabitans]|uniref:Aldehyde dehydrogenase domain-containing protein n=1 Tax=Nocardia rhizosphaerihabitans TaxID=1691570 RepID=A0ABQ2L334_9NOCA|nr:hypothetical protein GCM10011610_69630 [Nocardia rhizosphaerihabitans]
MVLTPDSQTPYCAVTRGELLYQAGLPRDLFAVVPGPGALVGTALDQNADYVMFTGSTATGRLLAEQADARLIGYSAELGGKNPMIVMAQANLREVTDAAVRACYSNSGQLCASIERTYVEQSIAPEFTRIFRERVAAISLALTTNSASRWAASYRKSSSKPWPVISMTPSPRAPPSSSAAKHAPTSDRNLLRAKRAQRRRMLPRRDLRTARLDLPGRRRR